jgi:hypothetical protein
MTRPLSVVLRPSLIAAVAPLTTDYGQLTTHIKEPTMTHHWDELSKSLAQPLPRRDSLRRLGLVVAGAVLGPLGFESTFAGKADPCKSFCKCRNKRQQDQCLKACNACNKDPSRLGGSCGNYYCCGAGQTSCGNYCADLAHDPYNCGACGIVCDEPGPNEYGSCIDAACQYFCSHDAVRCDGTCIAVNWDSSNCGDCGIVCPPEAPYCVWGACSFCPADLAACGTGCCASGEICVDGMCQPAPGEPCTPDHPYWPNC